MPGTACKDNDVTLLKAGVAAGPNKATASPWPAVAALASYSWAGADLAAFATTDFNDPNFGVQVSAISISGGVPTAEIDYIQITISYTVAGGGGITSSLAMTGAGK